MEIKDEEYAITYNPATETITCQGSLHLYGTEGYAEIMNFLDNIAKQQPRVITLKINDLIFLNSSGINTISKFIIRLRDQNISELIIQGSDKISWQHGTLKNLQQLMPDLKLEFV